VVSETKQTFVATICIAARDFIGSPIHLKQVQFLSVAGDSPHSRISATSDLNHRVYSRRASGNAICCIASTRYAATPRIESSHEFTRHSTKRGLLG
jgi:hypothetical protein